MPAKPSSEPSSQPSTQPSAQAQTSARAQASARPLVGIVMGSESDRDIVSAAERELTELGIAFETRVISAHRSPGLASTFAGGARERGLGVIIAAAGKAAHLAGVMAAHTTLPVIGIPIKSGDMGGMDALLATVQMPPGVPVATVAVDGARNAAILAAQILSLSDPAIASKLESWKKEMEDVIVRKSGEGLV